MGLFYIILGLRDQVRLQRAWVLQSSKSMASIYHYKKKPGNNQYLGGHLIPQVKDDTEESQSNFDFYVSIVEFSNSSK